MLRGWQVEKDAGRAMKAIAVIAIGGNSLTREGERGTFEEQQAHATGNVRRNRAVLQKGYRVVVTHGNGPQVGEALLRSERAQDGGDRRSTWTFAGPRPKGRWVTCCNRRWTTRCMKKGCRKKW